MVRARREWYKMKEDKKAKTKGYKRASSKGSTGNRKTQKGTRFGGGSVGGKKTEGGRRTGKGRRNGGGNAGGKRTRGGRIIGGDKRNKAASVSNKSSGEVEKWGNQGHWQLYYCLGLTVGELLL